MKVLIVDSHEDTLRRFDKALRRAGHEAILAKHCQGAESLLAEGRFEALVINIVMPEFTGVEIVRSMRRERPSLRIVAISGEEAGYPAIMGLKAAQALGADVVLYQPFSDETLIEALASS